MQQSQGKVAATSHIQGVAINEDASLEREADELGAKAARGVLADSPRESIDASLSASEAAIVQAKPDGQASLAGGAAPSSVPAKSNAAGEQPAGEKPAAESGVPELDAYKGATIGKVGKISAPAGQYEHAKTQGVNLRQRPHGALPPIAAIRYGREAQVVAADNTDAFYFIVATAEGLSGWINRRFVALDPPDPKAELHHITEPNLTTILKHRYIDTGLWQLRTGNDYTTLAAATIAANQGRAGVDINWSQYEAYKRENPVKRWLDPWMIENFAIYYASTVIAGTNIWLPSPAYVRALQGTGVIGSRPDWANAAVDAGNGLAGFFAGVSAGAFGTLWDTLAGLWELGASMVSAVRGVFDGSLLSSISELYDAVTNLSWQSAAKMVEDIITMGRDAFGDFKEAWGHPDTYKKWYFRGKVIGAVALEVVLAIFTGGAALGAKVIAKIGQYLPRLARVLGKLISVADKLDISGKRKHRGDGVGGRDIRSGRRRDGEHDKEMSREQREWKQTLFLARLATEEHDLKDTPVAELLAYLNSTFAVKSKAVRGYRAYPAAKPGHHRIVQFTKEEDVDSDYSGKEPEKKVTKAVNLPAWRDVKIDMEHIASGHVRGGSRVSPSKDLFPEYMGPKQIERAVREAYRFGEKISTQGERVLVRGTADRLTIEMWVNRTTKTIETAYPVF